MNFRRVRRPYPLSIVALLLPAQVWAQAAPEPPAAVPLELPPSKIEAELKARLSAMGGNGLTSKQAAERAVQSSNTLSAKRHALEASDASLSQARAGLWPELRLAARYTRLSKIGEQSLGSFGNGGLVVTNVPTPAPRTIGAGEQLLAVPANFSFPEVLDQYWLGATLTVPISDYVLRTSHAIESASHGKRAAELDQVGTRASVDRDARFAYYSWIRAQGQEIVAEQGVQQAEGHRTDAQNAFQAGLVSRADVMRAEAALQSAELFRERSKNLVVITALRLKVIMGDKEQANYQVGENIFADLPDLDRAPASDAAYEEALTKRPELRALESSEAALHQQAKVARAGNLPRLDAQGNLVYANPNLRYFPLQPDWHATWDVSVTLSWTPTAIPGAQAAGDVADARASELASQRAALRDALRIEVSEALQAVSEARYALSVTEHALRAAEESYRVRRELFRAGRATLVEVTDAETELTRARIEAVDSHVNARLALVALNHALGRDVVGG